MEASLPKPKIGSKSKPLWWSSDLERSKKALTTYKSRSDYSGEDRREYRTVRNRHLYLVGKAKSEAWKCFCNSANSNIWMGSP